MNHLILAVCLVFAVVVMSQEITAQGEEYCIRHAVTKDSNLYRSITCSEYGSLLIESYHNMDKETLHVKWRHVFRKICTVDERPQKSDLGIPPRPPSENMCRFEAQA